MAVRSGIAATIVCLLLSAGAAEGRQISTSCATASVHYTHRPGLGEQLGSLPWIEGVPAAQQLVGLLWYWPDAWRAQGQTSATIYSGGRAPGGRSNMKILWVFQSPKARTAANASQVVIKGHRLDGPGKSWQRFVEIAYGGQNGARSYASIVNLPSPGCWRLDLTAGPLHGSAVFAVL